MKHTFPLKKKSKSNDFAKYKIIITFLSRENGVSYQQKIELFRLTNKKNFGFWIGIYLVVSDNLLMVNCVTCW